MSNRLVFTPDTLRACAFITSRTCWGSSLKGTSRCRVPSWVRSDLVLVVMSPVGPGFSMRRV